MKNRLSLAILTSFSVLIPALNAKAACDAGHINECSQKWIPEAFKIKSLEVSDNGNVTFTLDGQFTSYSVIRDQYFVLGPTLSGPADKNLLAALLSAFSLGYQIKVYPDDPNILVGGTTYTTVVKKISLK
jgi:hypothetical protein